MFKRKTIKEIKEKLKTEIEKEIKLKYDQHLIDFEKGYLRQLHEQSEVHRGDLQKQYETLNNAKIKQIEYLQNLHNKDIEELNFTYNEEIKNLKQKRIKEIEDYKTKEKDLKRAVRDAQKAWSKITELHPQILSLLSMLRAKSDLKTREAAREQAEYSTMLNESEIIDRKLEKLEPGMEKLLHIDSPLLQEKSVDPEVSAKPSLPEKRIIKEDLKLPSKNI